MRCRSFGVPRRKYTFGRRQARLATREPIRYRTGVWSELRYASAMSDFPDHYPVFCPPENAVGGHGIVFRIVHDELIKSSDFISHYDAGTARTADECSRRGLSVFNSYEGARHRMSLSPQLGTRIAQGELHAQAGMISPPKPSSGHITWWVYRDFDPVPLFKVAP